MWAKGAAVYLAIVFALGFVLGTLRVLFTAPALGDVAATVLELPVMLAASWLVCGWTIRRFSVPPGLSVRIAMGALAFALLIGAETALGVAGFGRTLTEQAAAYRQTGPFLGLLAQMVFAAFPAFRR